MANTEQILSAGIGAAIGFAVAGPAGVFAGLQYGLLAGAALFPADLPSMQGPRMEDFEKVEADPGAPIARVFGTAPVTGFRMYLGQAREISNTEDVGGKGAPSQEVTTFTYLQTLAIGLCQGEIIGVNRIWENGTLKYDTRPQQTGESQTDYDARMVASTEYQNTFTVYLGTETQDPDPTLEAELGVGNVPAFRGLAYIVFPERVLQDNQGRRHPIFKIEVNSTSRAAIVAVGTNVTLRSLDGGETWIAPTTPPSQGPTGAPEDTNRAALRVVYFDQSRNRFLATGHLTVWASDDAGDTWYIISTLPDFANQVVDALYVPSIDTGFFCCGGSGGAADTVPRLYYTTDGGLTWTGLGIDVFGLTNNRWATGLCYNPVDDQVQMLITQPSGSGSGNGILGWAPASGATDGSNWQFTTAYANVDSPDGIHRGLIYFPPSGRTFHGGYVGSNFVAGQIGYTSPNDLTTGGTITLTGIVTGNLDGSGMAYIPDRQRLVTCWSGGNFDGSKRVAYSDAPHTSAWTVPAGYTPTSVDQQWLRVRYIAAAARVFGLTADGSIFSTEDGNTWNEVYDHSGALSDIAGGAGSASQQTTVGEVIQTICRDVGITVDTTEVDDNSIIGYVVNRPASALAALEPMRMVGQYDYVESGEVLKIIKRGKAPVATITTADLGAKVGSREGDAPGITTRKIQDVELPRQLRLKYLSQTRDYEPSEQLSPTRRGTAGVNEANVDVPVVLEDDHATQLAEVLFRDTWASRWAHEFSLNSKFHRLEPGDVLLVPVDGRDYRVRIHSIAEQSLLVRKISAVRDDDGSYTSVASNIPPSRTPQSVQLLAETDIELLDLPALDEADDDAGLYIAAFRTGVGNTWPGANISKSADEGETYSLWATIPTEATIGEVVTAPSGSTATWNYDTELVVDILTEGRIFDSRTRAAVLAGANTLAVGAHGRWQIVQFLNASLVSPGRYRLTGLLLGRRGTEHNVSNVIAGDTVVMLSDGNLYKGSLAIASIGLEQTYLPVTAGATSASATPETFTGQGQRLECFSPVMVRGERTGDDLDITWIRRDRLSETLRDGVAVPNSEATEAYEVDIMDGPDVVRTITGLSTPTAAYSAADQTTDFGSPQASVTVRVYQLSANVGRGTPAEATI